jgi:KAP family P-loop domain
MHSMSGVVSWFKPRKKDSESQSDNSYATGDKIANYSFSNPKTPFPKIITDEPSVKDDALEFEKYSQKLADIIVNSNPRFSIGIFGGWGTGKTTFMKMIEAELSGYIFNWGDILSNDRDKAKLERYIKENFDNTNWVHKEDIIKSHDGKSITIKNDTKSFSISIDEITNSVSISINGEQFNRNLVMKKENGRLDIYKNENNILTVWFDAWKYEREKYLAIIPFIRTIEIEIEKKLIELNQKDDRNYINDFTILKKWKDVKSGLEKTFDAFVESTQLNIGIGTFGSSGINLANFRKILRAEGDPIEIDNERIYNHHRHLTEYLKESISKLRNKEIGGNPQSRIVIFIDDLDRCSPEKALELLDSLKTFFDIEGFVYAIGIDPESINTIVKNKYGGEFDKGLHYMEKIVQLPFHLPTWKRGWTEDAISKSIMKIISKELKGSDLIGEFENNKKLIAKAVQSNPRQLKRFINNIIFAKTVFNDRDTDKLIVVQALDFRPEWNKFLELITPNDRRKAFFKHYVEQKGADKVIRRIEDLDRLSKGSSYSDILKVYRELINQEESDLRQFLDEGIDEEVHEKLFKIEKMEEYRVALDVTKTPDTLSNDFFIGWSSSYEAVDIATKLEPLLIKWAEIFRRDRILDSGELYSFEMDIFPILHTWLAVLRGTKDFVLFKIARDASTDMMSHLNGIKTEKSHYGIQLTEENKKSVLSKQRQLAESLGKINGTMPP